MIALSPQPMTHDIASRILSVHCKTWNCIGDLCAESLSGNHISTPHPLECDLQNQLYIIISTKSITNFKFAKRMSMRG